MSKSLSRNVLSLALLIACHASFAGTPLRVELPANTSSASGRLLVSLQPAAEAEKAAKDGKVSRVDVSPFSGGNGTLIGMDIPTLAAGKAIRVDTETAAYPSGLSELAPGDYYVQAVLDTARDNNYGNHQDDVSSTPIKISLGKDGDLPVLKLDQRMPPTGDYWELPATLPEGMRAQILAAKPNVKLLDMPSPKLSAFWGRPVHVRGWVVLPPDYEKSKTRYPIAYSTHGFGGNLRNSLFSAASSYTSMQKGETPPMIWVFLDESSATGTHEFADSVNNGPWGSALTEEVIPQIDRNYRTDGNASGRFVTGHSSGGWASLWLQVRYPKTFGGSWPTAPDAGDFHDFTGANLYASNANVYKRADGTLIPLVRMKGKVIATFEQFAKLEAVTGPVGGQMSSFEWVFSPRGEDGRPVPMFDRSTGVVDPNVVAYWRDNYDIAHRITTQWPVLKKDLDGKLHVIVGTADTFYLDGPARKLQAVMKKVGAKTDFRFVPDRTHGDLYAIGDDRRALARVIAWEMYKVARPQAEVPADLPKVPVEAAENR